MGKIFIDIGVRKLQKNAKEYVAAYDAEPYNEEKGSTYRLVFDESDVEVDYEDGEFHVTISNGEHDVYANFSIKPDPDMIIAMSEAVVKEYNRARTFFESRPR